MTCTQNHKTPEECVRSDCAPIGKIANEEIKCERCGFVWISKTQLVCPNINNHFKEEKLLENGDIFYAKPQPQLSNPMSALYIPKSRMTPDETFIQWLKIIGLTIALGVMVYQTYLLWQIYETIFSKFNR